MKLRGVINFVSAPNDVLRTISADIERRGFSFDCLVSVKNS